MQTPEFAAGLDEPLRLAARSRTAVMCAESVPWRCHRRLVADAAAARGVLVHHILSTTRLDAHRITPFGYIAGNLVTYPLENVQLFPYT